MGIQINGSSDIISAADGSLTISGADLTSLTQVAVSGVSTFSQVSFGSTINVRIGDTNTGCSLTSGTNNNFLGASAGRNTTTGFDNNFFGRCAGFCNTTGNSNNFFGPSAGFYNTTASSNNFFGVNAGRNTTTGCRNNFFGLQAGEGNTTGSQNNFFGQQVAGSGTNTGSYNNYFGFVAGFKNTTGCNNNFFGCQAGCSNTTGSFNNFFGSLVGRCNTTGSHNNFFGSQAGPNNTTGCYNNFFGLNAGRYNTTGNDNNFFGRFAGCTNTTGGFNNFFGQYAGRCNTTGCFNNFFGRLAGCSNTTACRNVFIGQDAGQFNTTGSANNFLGYYAGGKTTTGSCNTFLGRYAGCSNTTGSHNIAIGNGAQLASATASCQLVISAGGVNFLHGNSSGNLGIGTDNPSRIIDVRASSSQNAAFILKNTGNTTTGANSALSLSAQTSSTISAGYGPALAFEHRDTSGAYAGALISSLANADPNGADLVLSSRYYGYVEGLRITSSGTVGIGTDNPAAKLSVVGPSSGGGKLFIDTKGAFSGTDTATLGFSVFDDGTARQNSQAEIRCIGDGNYSGSLAFYLQSPGTYPNTVTERMRITSGGYFKATSDGTYHNSTGSQHELRQNASGTDTLVLTSTNASLAAGTLEVAVTRAASTAYNFFRGWSGGFGDLEFNLRGDGNAFADGSWNGGGADYAEYFEWSDSNPDAEDRRGISVVLDGEKIRPAIAGEDPIGVISGNPSVVGDSAWNKWSGKYLRDEFGTYIQEDYEVENEDGNTVVQQRRKLNPAYDPDAEYIPREQRPEWDCVGLMGKLRIRKGQVTGSRWIKMRDISDTVEEWLVR